MIYNHFMIAEIVGYTASLLAIGMFIPQVIKSWKTKEMRGVSTISFLLVGLQTVTWMTYGFLINSAPIIFANSIVLILTIIILVLKKKYP